MISFAQGYNYKYGSHRGYNSPYTHQQPSSWSGTGIAIDTRYIATNHHVVDGATNLAIYFPESDKRYKAEVIVVDREHDLAIIKVTDSGFAGFNNIKYGFKVDVEDVGMGVFVLGYPLVQSMGTEIKLTTGVVSSRSGFQGDKSQYQISAPVQPGNSGGPLFNDDGELIGIISAKHTEAENASYGVKLSYLKLLANSITGLNFNRTSQLYNLSLSEKCKSVIPCTVMILANNDRSPQSQQQVSRQSYSSGSSSGSEYSTGSRSYPIRINNPRIGKVNDVSVKIYGIEITENYTAVHMSWTNTEYKDGWYCVDKGMYIYIPTTGKKYPLKTTDNCAIKPQQTKIAYGQTKAFALDFESIPAETSIVDIIEPGSDGWRFYRIKLSL